MSKLGGYVPEGLFVVALWTVWVPKLDLGWNSCSFGVPKSWGKMSILSGVRVPSVG